MINFWLCNKMIMRRSNTITKHSCKVQKEGGKTKADIQVVIRPALTQWEYGLQEEQFNN